MVKKYFLVTITSHNDTNADDVLEKLKRRIEGESVKVEAVEQPLALDDAHVCGWCKGKQNLVWSCPVCDVG